MCISLCRNWLLTEPQWSPLLWIPAWSSLPLFLFYFAHKHAHFMLHVTLRGQCIPCLTIGIVYTSPVRFDVAPKWLISLYIVPASVVKQLLYFFVIRVASVGTAIWHLDTVPGPFRNVSWPKWANTYLTLGWHYLYQLPLLYIARVVWTR